jgi:hypothetical protein
MNITTFSILPAVNATMPLYGNVIASPVTLRDIAASNVALDDIGAINESLANMSKKEFEHFDFILIALSGYTLSTLTRLGEKTADTWANALVREMHNDINDPIMESSRVMRYWAALSHDERSVVEKAFLPLFSLPITEMLATIHDHIAKAVQH